MFIPMNVYTSDFSFDNTIESVPIYEIPLNTSILCIRNNEIKTDTVRCIHTCSVNSLYKIGYQNIYTYISPYQLVGAYHNNQIIYIFPDEVGITNSSLIQYIKNVSDMTLSYNIINNCRSNLVMQSDEVITLTMRKACNYFYDGILVYSV
jgi:hypothetical protein